MRTLVRGSPRLASSGAALGGDGGAEKFVQT